MCMLERFKVNPIFFGFEGVDVSTRFFASSRKHLFYHLKQTTAVKIKTIANAI